MQSKEQKLVSLFAQARRLCEQAAKITHQARKLRLKARDLESPGNPKANANAAAELRKDAQRARDASRQQLGQLFNTKEETESYLLAFNESGKPFRKALQELSFNSQGSPSQDYFDSDEDGILRGCHQFQQLAQVAVRTLAPQIELTKDGDIRQYSQKRSKTRRGTRLSKHPSTYSRADDARFHRIGLEMIQTHTNRELWKKYGASERKLIFGYDDNAFRHSLNRIRTHHRLPTSQDLQKSDQAFGHKK